MPRPRSLGYRAIRVGALLYAAVESGVRSVGGALQVAVGAFLNHALTTEEQSDLSIALYDATPREWTRRRGLAAWEQAWFRRDLPKDPAHILVGAAGGGREAAALCARGYRVDALEPAPGLAGSCRMAIGAYGEVVVATYEELARAVLDGESNAASALATRRYDAVILGWGSLSLVERAQQTRLVEACARLTPNGPVLASFLTDSQGPSALHTSLSFRGGGAAGRWVRRMRGITAPVDDRAFATFLGFVQHLDDDELRVIARAIDRDVRLDSDAEIAGYPHATFTPRTSGDAKR